PPCALGALKAARPALVETASSAPANRQTPGTRPAPESCSPPRRATGDRAAGCSVPHGGAINRSADGEQTERREHREEVARATGSREHGRAVRHVSVDDRAPVSVTRKIRGDDGRCRARTCDPLLVRQVLSQLS